MSYTQIIIILKSFKYFIAGKNVLGANHHYPGKIQRLFRLQNHLRRKSSLSWQLSKTFSPAKCLSRKSSLSWKYSNSFSPAKLSSTQIILILKIFKNFFACKFVLSANHHYAESIQRFFRLQNCLRRKSPSDWKHSKTFSPAILS